MKLISAKPTSDFQLELMYENGELREFDMRPFLTSKPWNKVSNLVVFMQVKVFYNTIVWPGGIDIAPETLFLDSKPIAIKD